MPKISFFGALTNIQMLVFTVLHGRFVGRDAGGNKYYKGKPRAGDRFCGQPRERRWVVYKGAPEASTVPAEWHGWLHHQTDEVPQDKNPRRPPWQKQHKPNMTGTADAYLPPGHPRRQGQRPPATGDYQPWQPPHPHDL